MIEILLNSPRVLHQMADNDMEVEEHPITSCHDASGLIILSQENRQILVNRASVDEFIKLLQNQKMSAEIFLAEKVKAA